MTEHEASKGTGGDGDDGRVPALFDLRTLIGGLFTLYGVVLIVASPFIDDSKADGLDMNLWLGLSMLLLGVGFLGWVRWRPLRTEGTSAAAKRSSGH
ncbi:MAG: hypothetical protein U0Q15_16885 [Kineosporiaceae bacterium]